MVLLSGPNLCGNENKYVKDCIDTGWVSSVGSYVTRFENQIKEFCNSKHAIATSSGTTALHVSLILSDVQKNDYVIVPNLTFVASLNSIKYTGADPILVDVCPDSWQMDLNLLESFLKNYTYNKNGVCHLKKNDRKIKVIMPVHVFGNMCDMDKLFEISSKYNLSIVEDSTEALGSTYKKKFSGTFGKFGCFSFNGNKLITTGGGGMIVTDDDKMAFLAKHITTQAKSDSFEYYHDMIGYNYRLTNVSSAIGVAQMENIDKFLKRKDEINNYYRENLSKISGKIIFQEIHSNVKSNFWLFTIRSKKQKEILNILNENAFQSRPLWVPMNKLPMFSKDIFVTNSSVTDNLYEECLSIPCSTDIINKDLDNIISLISKVYS